MQDSKKEDIHNEKWSSSLFSVHNVLTQNLSSLHSAGHAPSPTNYMHISEYPYHNLSIAVGLADCYKALEQEDDGTGDTRPTINFNVETPFPIEKQLCDVNGHLTNKFDLFGLESDHLSKTVPHGLFHQQLLIEAVSPRGDYLEPTGPKGFKPIKRASAESWAGTADLTVPQFFKSSEAAPSSATKCSRQTECI